MRRKWRVAMVAPLLILTACGGGGSSAGSGGTGGGGGGGGGTATAAAPAIAASAAQGGAQLVTLSTSTSGATIYYTTDGTTPTTKSPSYQAPFLITASTTVQAMAVASGMTASSTTARTYTLNVPSGTLVWSDEFTNTSGTPITPNAAVWTYDTGNSGFGNNELETYCAAGSNDGPCSTATPNAFVASDGLHIVARNPSAGVYTSARLKTQGLFSFAHGRLEVSAKLPLGQGLWPAIWTLGNSIATASWPACGEQDIMEHINGAGNPDQVHGSIHSPGANLTQSYSFASGVTSAAFHTYGMVWNARSVAFYVDDPANIYATYTADQVTAMSGGVWPFDNGQANFIILNLAVGGSWPGSPDGTTPWPSEMVVRYVRLYTN